MAQALAFKDAVERVSRTSDKIVLDVKGVVELTTYSKSVIYDLVKRGEFPKQKRIGPNRAVWVRSEVVDWLEAKLAAAEAA